LVAVEAVGDEDPPLILSLAEIEQHPLERVEPGPQRITIDLPWGRWSRLIYPEDSGSPVYCELPARIGREPLRNIWLRSAIDQDPPAVAAQTARRMAAGLPTVISMLGQSVDGDDRIEPFSRTTLPEWDLLFSAGRLDAVSEARIRELASDAPDDLAGAERALLMLGLGYAALNQGSFEALSATLASIDGILKKSWDYALLANRLRAEEGRKDAETQAANIRRLGNQHDRHLAPPLVLNWSAALLASLYMNAEAAPPNWVSRLAPNSIIAVRTRADAHIEDHTEPSARSVAKPAKQRGGKRSTVRPAAEGAATQDIYGEVHNRLRERRPESEPAPADVEIDRLDDESEGYMEA
jgi:hypothetical protein